MFKIDKKLKLILLSSLISLVVVIVVVMFLVPGKTKFDNLPEEQKKIIENEFKTVLWKHIAEFFQNWMKNSEDIEKKMADDIDKIKAKYSHVDFWDLKGREIAKLDNSRAEKPDTNKKDQPEKKPEPVRVKRNDSLIIKDRQDNSKHMTIKITDLVWRKTKEKWTCTSDEYDTYYPDCKYDEFLAITFYWENSGKKPNSYSISDWAILVTRDWFEYKPLWTLSIAKIKEGYESGLESSMNPWEKWEEDLIFDINKVDLAWAVLKINRTHLRWQSNIEPDLFEFEL